MIVGPARQAPRIVAFFDELKGLGFVEGQNLNIVPGGFDLRNDQYAEYAMTLTESNPNVIFCVGDAATLAAKEATQTIPVVGLFRHLHSCSGCFRLERSPGGICTHWKAPPCHGAHPSRTLVCRSTT